MELDQPAEAAKHPNYSVSAAFQYMMNMWDEVLHRYADIELGHILGLPELFAKIQKVHTELVTVLKKNIYRKMNDSHWNHAHFI